MTEVKLGAATVRRIEESYEPNFDAKMFFPDLTPEVASRVAGLSPGMEFLRLRGGHRRAVHLPYRPQGKRLRAALRGSILERGKR
jgi:hypothetical protein